MEYNYPWVAFTDLQMADVCAQVLETRLQALSSVNQKSQTIKEEREAEANRIAAAMRKFTTGAEHLQCKLEVDEATLQEMVGVDRSIMAWAFHFIQSILVKSVVTDVVALAGGMDRRFIVTYSYMILISILVYGMYSPHSQYVHIRTYEYVCILMYIHHNIFLFFHLFLNCIHSVFA